MFATMILFCGVVATSGANAMRAGERPPSSEQEVKAAFLFNFAPFVEWPSGAWSAADESFSICLRGEDPFGATLDDAVRGQKVSGRAVIVRRLEQKGDVAGCQMLFAGQSAEPGYAPFADTVGRPVLTVADRESGISGAMIAFVTQGGRVRFDIDDSLARQNGLVISSKLLSLAVSVDRK